MATLRFFLPTSGRKISEKLSHKNIFVFLGTFCWPQKDKIQKPTGRVRRLNIATIIKKIVNISIYFVASAV